MSEDTKGSSDTTSTGSSTGSNSTGTGTTGKKRNVVEEIEVAGGQLVERVKELASEGSTRRVIIRSTDGKELLTVPLTFGVVGGALLAVAAPAFAAVGALAALVTRVKLEVVPMDDKSDDDLIKSDTPRGPGTSL